MALKEEGIEFAALKDKVTLQDWYNINNRIEKFVLNDGTQIDTAFLFDPTENDDNLTFGAEDNVIHALAGNDVIVAGAGNDTVYGEAGNDNLQGQDGNDTLDGGVGNDTLYGQAGDDVIDGGAGADTLYGDVGNETYLFGRGDGIDMIAESANQGNDTLRFKEGITVDDLIIKQLRNDSYVLGADFVIGLKEDGKAFDQLSDKITIQNGAYYHDYYSLDFTSNSGYDYRIENFEFADGTKWTMADLVAHTNSDDNDAIHGFRTADTLTGGKGNDILKGYSGDDTYLFNRGDGQDVIYDYGRYQSNYSYYNAGNDTLKLGADIDKNSIIFLMSGGNLIVDTGKGDTVTIQSQTAANNRIETIVSNDAAYMTYIDIERVIQDAQIYADENGIALTADNVRANTQLMSIMSSLWRDTLAEQGYGAPIVLDMNANGKTSVSLTDSHTYFDYAADGLKEHTAWIERGDALLVRDINNDGIINDGSELFGDKTKLTDGSLATDGYTALAQYDTNSDGVIDKNDTDFSQLKLWKDANQNGKTDAGELVDLSVAGVTSLSLNTSDGSVYTQTTENGNIITNETNYTTLSDTGTMRDVWFKIDATDTITDNDMIYGTSEAETLSGDVGNDTYVIAFGGGVDVIDDNGNGADTIKFISGITADRLIVQWIRGTDDLRIGILENAEDDTPITELSNTLTIKNWFNETGAIEQFSFSDGSTLNRQGTYDLLLDVEGDLTMRVLDAGDTLSGNSGNDVLYGLEGSEMLYGKEGSDYLSGLSGDDYLSAGAGDDTLEGGIGADTLEGGIGDDYYLFEKGDGKDLIIDAGGVDTLYFGNTINSRDVLINEVGEDLVLTFGYDSETSMDTIDQITIKNWNVDDFKLESFAFSSGESYTLAELIEKNTNHAPEMFFEENDRNLGKERSAKGILLADDIDGDSLTYAIVSAPTMGTISINQYGIWTYTGTSRDAGTDMITIAIQDGRGGEVMTTLSFIMEALNQAPEAPSETSHTLQDIRILSGEVGATDIDGDILTYAVSAQAAHGTFSVDTNGVWSYSAADGYMGEDSAIVTIDDNNGGIITQTLSFDVKVSAPTLSDSTSGLLEDTPISGALSVVNPIGGTLVYEILKSSMKGTFDIDAQGNWSYDPALNVNGDDSVTIKVTNEYGLSSTATLNLAIEAVNDAPVATSEEAFVLQDIRVQIGAVEATDVENDILTYTVSTAAEHGTLSVNEAGEWSYSAADGYMGSDSAIITIDDGNGGVITQTLNFEVKVSAPTLSDTTSGLLEDTSTNGVFNVTNPIGGALVYEVVNASAKGAFSVNEAGEWNYTPNADLNGEDSVTLRVTNAYGLSTTATLNLAIEAVNDTPIVTASITLNAVAEDSGVIIITKEQLLASSYDVDGDLLSVSNLSVSAGTLVDNLDGTWSLTPDLDYNGTITLDYTVTDTHAYAAATATQIVTALNDAPILIETPLPITLDAGMSTTGSIKASDVDGDVLSYRITSTPAHGELSINENGEWSYSAERYYAGESNATISIDDGHGESITTTLNFTNLMTPDWHYTYGGETLTINDNDGEDILMMNDISMSDLTFLQEGNNLRIDVKDKNDVILTDYFTSPTKGIESIQTAEGAINLSKERIGSSGSFFGIKWGSDNNDLISGSDNRSDLILGHNGNDILFGKGYGDLLYGNGGNDLLIGGEGNDTLSGESGDDILYGDNGNDTLCGDEGNDKLFGGKGNDMIEGGAGNDLLHGGEGTNTLIGSTGNDTYLATKGSNNTIIHENILGFNFFGHYIGQNGGNDTLLFGEGITKEDISFLMRGNDLLLQYGESEFITINNQKNEANRIEKLQLSDGSYLTNSDMDQIIQQLSAYSKDHGFHLKDNTQIQNNQAMMNIVAAGWHTL